ncbi:unnamed protein product [Caenorhabditis bovis]|uniref:NELF-A N-terminal domain-containing protein n=1 Tax=Caenorhabditis bovis TaxID=2654633 RepID=A0A8S1EPX1_9PELO|nr:unnamed protein product [Caenorhabditis bovis]
MHSFTDDETDNEMEPEGEQESPAEMDFDESGQSKLHQKRHYAASLKDKALVEYLEMTFGETDYWAACNNVELLSKDMLEELDFCFQQLTTQTKLKFLICIAYVSDEEQKAWKVHINRLLDVTRRDGDEWIETVAETYKMLPSSGGLNRDEYSDDVQNDIDELTNFLRTHSAEEGSELVSKIYRGIVKKILKKAFGPGKDSPNHFILKKRPRSFIFQQDLEKRKPSSSKEPSTSQKNTSLTSTAVESTALPIKMRSTQRLPNNKLPMKGIPTHNTWKLNGGFTNEPKKFQRTLPQKKGGAMLLDIADLPPSLKKRRQVEKEEEAKRKAEEKEKAKQRALELKKEKEEAKRLAQQKAQEEKAKAELEKQGAAAAHAKTERKIAIPRTTPRKNAAAENRPAASTTQRQPQSQPQPKTEAATHSTPEKAAEAAPVEEFPRIPSPQTFQQFENEIRSKAAAAQAALEKRLQEQLDRKKAHCQRAMMMMDPSANNVPSSSRNAQQSAQKQYQHNQMQIHATTMPRQDQTLSHIDHPRQLHHPMQPQVQVQMQSQNSNMDPYERARQEQAAKLSQQQKILQMQRNRAQAEAAQQQQHQQQQMHNNSQQQQQMQNGNQQMFLSTPAAQSLRNNLQHQRQIIQNQMQTGNFQEQMASQQRVANDVPMFPVRVKVTY